MTRKEKLFEDINKHTRYWDCYNDRPLEYDHTGKVLKICKENTVSFLAFCVENYSFEFWDVRNKLKCLSTGNIVPVEQVYKKYENGT